VASCRILIEASNFSFVSSSCKCRRDAPFVRDDSSNYCQGASLTDVKLYYLLTMMLNVTLAMTWRSTI